MFRFEKILDLLIEISYLGVIFLVPLYFAVFLPTNTIFELNKLVLFKIFVLLLLIFSLTKIILLGGISKIFKLFDKRFVVILFFFLSLVFSTIFSINKELSFWGLYSRFQGLESHIYYLAFFILVYLNLRLLDNLKNKITNIIIAGVFSSFLVAIYAILQYLGYDFFVWAEPAYITKRAFSTLGQPNYLASYLLLVIPLSIYLFFQSKKFLVRFFVFLVLFFQILALMFSGSRAGILGFGFAIFAFGLVYSIYNFQKLKVVLKNKKFFIVSSLFLMIILLVILGRFLFLPRFSDINDLKSGSIALRMDYWRVSIDAIRNKPFFGYGLDAQKEVFSKYYQRDWGIYSDVNTIPHRAHNFILDSLLTSGTAGLIVYLALLYLFFRLCLRIYREKNNFSFLSLCILAGVVGYLFFLLFGFAIVVTQIYFWLFLAIIFSLQGNNKKLSFEYSKLSFKSFLFKLILLIILAVPFFYQTNQAFKYIKADYYFRGMVQSFNESNYFKALEYWLYIKDEKLQYNYYNNEAGLIIANLTQDQKEDFFKKVGRKELEEILSKINNDNYSDIFLKAQIYWALGENEKAEEYFDKAIKLSSEKERNYQEFARFYYLTKDYNKAIKYYEKSLEFLPDLNSSYINERHKNRVKHERYLIYKGLGDAYFDTEEYDQAIEYYKLALNDNPSDLKLIKEISDSYYKKGDFGTAIWYNKHGMARNPSDYVWPYSIALLYEENNERENAIEYYKKALGLLPRNKFLENKINELN